MRGTHTQKKQVNPGAAFAILILIFALIAALVWGFIQRSGPFARIGASQAGSGQTLTIDTAEPLNSLDPSSDTSLGLNQALIGNVYETLVGRDEHNNPAKTGVARDWTISSDNLTYTFDLEPNARFSNGHTLDSADAVFSLRQIIEKQTAGYTRLSRIAKVDGSGHTLILTLNKPDPNLLWSLSTQAGIIYDSEASYDKAQKAIGSGPYTVSRFAPGQSLELKVNPYYAHASRAYASKVILKTQADPQAAAQELADRKVDAIIPLNNAPSSNETSAAVQTLKTHKDITVAQTQSNHRWAIVLNNSADSLFSDERAREAYATMLDRNSLISQLGIGAQPTATPLSPLEPGYQAVDANAFDLARARKLLSYFRYPRNLTLDYSASAGETIASTLAQQFMAAGGTVTPQALDSDQWQQQVVENHQFDMALIDLTQSHEITSLLDPNYFMDYTSSNADSIRSQIENATTEDDYAALTGQAAQIMIADRPIIWAYVEAPYVAYKSNVSGIPQAMIDERLPLKDIIKK